MAGLVEPVTSEEEIKVREVWLDGWRLFAVISAVITTFKLLRLASADFSSPQDLSAMIQYSVRWAVPFIFLVIATSALARLFPSRFTRWLLRNRRYIGPVSYTHLTLPTICSV